MKETIRAFTLLLLIVAAIPAWAVQNITGIWEGKFNPLKHVRIQISTAGPDTDVSIQAMAEDLLSPLLNPSAELRTSKGFTRTFKSKITYEEDTIHFTDMSGSPVNFLHFVGFPKLFAEGINFRNIPSLKTASFPLSGTEEKVIIPTSATGEVPSGNDKVLYDFSLISTLTLPDASPYALMNATMIFDVKMKKASSNGKTGRFKVKVSLPLARNTDPAPWETEEITLLLTGLSQHPFSDVSVNGSEEQPPLRLAERIWGDTIDGYTHLLRHAMGQYSIKSPVKSLMDMDLPVEGRYERSDEPLIRLGKKAYSRNLIFLPSVYVREYTHHKQSGYKDGERASELEAHCVHQRWIKENFIRYPELNSSTLEDLLSMVEQSFVEKFPDEELNCSGQLKRWPEMKKELAGAMDPGQQTGGQRLGTPSPDISGEQNWHSILND